MSIIGPPWAQKLWGNTVTTPPYFIKAQHPKASVAPSRESVARMLGLGYLAQRKVNGHRAQVHVSEGGQVVAFTRSGTRHTEAFPPALAAHLAEHFKPASGWSVFDTEWQKQEAKLYFFDLLRLDGEALQSTTYEERHRLLGERFVIGPQLAFLPILRELQTCMVLLIDSSPFTEGLIFRAPAAKGFHDSSILRCRKTGMFFEPAKLT